MDETSPLDDVVGVNFGIQLGHGSPTSVSHLAESIVTIGFVPDEASQVDVEKSSAERIIATIVYPRINEEKATRVIVDLHHGKPVWLSAGIMLIEDKSQGSLGELASNLIDSDASARVHSRAVVAADFSLAQHYDIAADSERLGVILANFSHETMFQQEAKLCYPDLVEKYHGLRYEGKARAAESYMGYFGYSLLHRWNQYAVLIDYAKVVSDAGDIDWAVKSSTVDLSRLSEKELTMIRNLRLSPSAVTSSATEVLADNPITASSGQAPKGYAKFSGSLSQITRQLLDRELSLIV